ncbi:MAG TPA: hypothetical protein VKE30_08920 [Chthoniobacterales bacterium]|nr:hypothetical protein [Chthoniobacterales bacterium]
MKPLSEWNDWRRSGDPFRPSWKRGFPVTDCNYQAFSPHRYHGGSTGRSGPSFLNISRGYFRYEARRNFVAEAAFFLAIAAILAATFISGAVAIIRFLHLPAA